MKFIIYYFTATGNNLSVARGLQRELGNTTILPIAVLLDNKEIPEEYDMIGICAPSYYSHVPPFVMRCLEGVKFKDNQIVFTVIGCGGNRGHAIEDIRDTVKASGKTVKYEFAVTLPGNHILAYGAFPMIIQKTILSHNKKKIKKIADALKAEGPEIHMGKSLLFTKKTDDQVKDIIASYGELGKQYKVSEKCMKCRTCVKVCPVRNITMDGSRVQFGDSCQRCMACIQWCPTRAIDKDNITEKRKRYHHPLINVEDIMENNRHINQPREER